MYNFDKIVFKEALKQVELILLTDNPEEINVRIGQLMVYEDLLTIALMLLVIKSKGGDISGMTDIKTADLQPTFKDLILPPGEIKKWIQ